LQSFAHFISSAEFAKVEFFDAELCAVEFLLRKSASCSATNEFSAAIFHKAIKNIVDKSWKEHYRENRN